MKYTILLTVLSVGLVLNAGLSHAQNFPPGPVGSLVEEVEESYPLFEDTRLVHIEIAEIAKNNAPGTLESVRSGVYKRLKAECDKIKKIFSVSCTLHSVRFTLGNPANPSLPIPANAKADFQNPTPVDAEAVLLLTQGK